ncbi:hypothetical protein PRZ48_006809 [Zasmidium cellare]|uniref:Carboxylic ester hydrolase n=1 Tax=Zasmidium cellare TaxID=395010 RepID=A0ABR0EIH3_ZASCE|nr:hypothetical protein PRZ48_006809 [Zasmidium cellare]
MEKGSLMTSSSLFSWAYFTTFVFRASACLPVVDLGYAVQEAFPSDDAGGYYNFTNIRFGAPPIGQWRFRAPRVPEAGDRHITNGGFDNIVCPSVMPSWMNTVNQQIGLLENALQEKYQTLYTEVLEGVVVNATEPSIGTLDGSTPGENVTEDCLFLDLVDPHSVWENRNSCSTTKAPVIVWIYGGGYVNGNKRNVGNDDVSANVAGGLVGRSIAIQNNTIEPTIVVLPNYRLGLFGWLAGGHIIADGTPNAALFDQRLALEWVEKYIHLFGGDPDRVTLMGQSAGGGSIEHHITSYGGERGWPPFQRAILQSPIFYPQPANDHTPENMFNQVLFLANVSSLQELRNASSETLQRVNEIIINNSSYGYFTFGPVVDGDYVPDLPGKLLAEGRYHGNIHWMLGHNQNHPFVFVSPSIANTSRAFEQSVTAAYLEGNASTISFMTKNLFPDKYSGSEGYITTFGRQEHFLNASQMICNNLFLAQVQPESTYWYGFDVPPAYHTQDLAYTWADYPPVGYGGFDVDVAASLQEFILSFAAGGAPSSSTANVSFLAYSRKCSVLNLGTDRVSVGMDHTDKEVCAWWQAAPYAT